MNPSQQDPGPAEALIPPRPNLGPEPWPEPSVWPTGLAGWGLALGLGVILLVVAWRWRRRRSKRGLPGTSGSSELVIEVDPSPRQRLIASSEKVRRALIGEFGPGWGSKTTEEIIDDSRLTDRLGPDEAGRLVEFLRLSDRAKFARNEPDTLDDWEAWAEGFVNGLAAKASRG